MIQQNLLYYMNCCCEYYNLRWLERKNKHHFIGVLNVRASFPQKLVIVGECARVRADSKALVFSFSSPWLHEGAYWITAAVEMIGAVEHRPSKRAVVKSSHQSNSFLAGKPLTRMRVSGSLAPLAKMEQAEVSRVNDGDWKGSPWIVSALAKDYAFVPVAVVAQAGQHQRQQVIQ